MTITKNLTPKLFLTAFIMTTIVGSHQLNTMEQKSITTNEEVSLDVDFQTYLVLSTLNDEHQCYLLPELVQIITTNVSKLIDKDYYEKYEGQYLNHPNSLLCFIENRCSNSMSHMCIANLIKRCLNHISTSLGKIKNQDDTTVFHQIAYESIYINPKRNKVFAQVEWIKILCLVAGNEAWDIICMKDNIGCTSLRFNHRSPHIINALLSTAPSSQAAWNLIITPDIDDETIFDFVQWKNYTEIIELLESYRPKEQ